MTTYSPTPSGSRSSRSSALRRCRSMWPSSWTATAAGRKAGEEPPVRPLEAVSRNVRETIRCASDVSVRYLTICSFSSENWKRSWDGASASPEPVRHHDAGRVVGLLKTRARDDHRAHRRASQKTRDAFAKAWEDEGQRRDDADGGRELRRPRGAARRCTVPWTARMPRCAKAANPSLSEATLPSRHLYTGHPPTPTCSSEPAARCACRTSCCGRLPIPSSCTETLCGLRPLRVLARAAGVPVTRSPVRGVKWVAPRLGKGRGGR